MSRPLSSHAVALVAFAGEDHRAWGVAVDQHLALRGVAEPGPRDGHGLEVSPTAEPPPPGELPVPDLLPAEVRGTPLDAAAGIAGTIPMPGDGADSLRVALAWFPDGRALALQALRPAKARGHDRDLVAAVVFEDGAARPVEDPRLSVTLRADGRPRRAGLELWVASNEGTPDYPRRAAGEIEEGPLALEPPGMTVAAYGVQWRSRGEVGPGVFVLIRPR